MPAPEASQVVIACPHCGTRYHVPYAAIGAKGRTVACAHCGQSWEAHAAKPPRQKDFDELAEEALDEKMVAEERRLDVPGFDRGVVAFALQAVEGLVPN